jgi:hypothetical protein
MEGLFVNNVFEKKKKRKKKAVTSNLIFCHLLWNWEKSLNTLVRTAYLTAKIWMQDIQTWTKSSLNEYVLYSLYWNTLQSKIIQTHAQFCICLVYLCCLHMLLFLFTSIMPTWPSQGSMQFMAVKIWILIFWVMTLRRLIGGYKCLSQTCCLHFHGKKWRRQVILKSPVSYTVSYPRIPNLRILQAHFPLRCI